MKTTVLLGLLLLCSGSMYSQTYEVASPDGRIEVTVQVDETVSWSVTLAGKEIIPQATIGMDFSEGPDMGMAPKVRRNSMTFVEETVVAGLPHKDASMPNVYYQLELGFRGKYGLRFRVYDEGVAYQWIDENTIARQVMGEQLSFTLPGSTRSLFPQEESMYSHYERSYLDKAIEELQPEDFCSLPVLFSTPQGKVLFTETALHDYPGMFIRGNGNTTLDAQHPGVVLEVIGLPKEPDRGEIITQEAEYIAEAYGAREYPWRVFVITQDDRTLVETNLTYLLAKPQQIEDTDWIKPGKVAWDWYNANNIWGVDFESGLNTATYKYFIDFAAAQGIEYVILDEGWSKTTEDITDFNPDMDVPELIRYGKEKGVGIILWVLWKPLNKNLEGILQTYQDWGAVGVKVDFMQRTDQYVVNYYERVAAEAAKHKLLVDFHGAFKPSGLRRAYPNLVTYEGLKGNEHNKWSEDITPEHTLTLPFTRMVAGPMDFTPGAMANRHAVNFGVSFERPMSLGTRAHQVAMYVVFESPLQMLCESPTRYYQEQETVGYITQIPTVWDETRVLEAAVGDYLVLARRRADAWYLGAMTDSTAREFTLDLSFLPAGEYTLEYF
ncbi:MAG: glycoside hydrolase family 97 protein, partial [Bacteroidota bacterium]